MGEMRGEGVGGRESRGEGGGEGGGGEGGRRGGRKRRERWGGVTRKL